MAKKPAYVPDTPLEVLEANCQHLKSKAGTPNQARAALRPVWHLGQAPGTDAIEMAELGDLTLYAAITSADVHRNAPEGVSRISWSIASEKADSIIGGGAAGDMDEAKQFAYTAYQAAHGVVKRKDD